MALKDWNIKHFDERKFGIERKDNELIKIFFYKEDGLWKSHQNTAKQKRFRTHGTKSQALRYAKSYMKKH